MHTINFTAREVPGLISVSTDLNTSQVLAGYEYDYTAVVSWAVPQGALRDINTDEVKLYITITPSDSTRGKILFGLNPGERSEQLFLSLNCIVVNGSCSSDSVLNRSANIIYRLNQGENASDEQLTVKAALIPFVETSVVAETDALISNISSIKLNATQQGIFANATRDANDGNYFEAVYQMRDLWKDVEPKGLLGFAGVNWSIDDWKPIAIFIVLVAVGVLALWLFKGKKRRKRLRNIGEMEESEVKGRDYREESYSPPDDVEYSPSERKPEQESDGPTVQRVPDWF